MEVHRSETSWARALQPLRSIGWGGTVLLFGSGGLLLYLVIAWLVPASSSVTSVEPVLLWFVLAGLVFLLPLVVAAALLLRHEGASVRVALWGERLRFCPMGQAEWLWTLGGLAAIGLLTVGSMPTLQALQGERRPTFFVALEPLTPERYWILAAWLPFFVLNVLGEEFVWRGVVLPRQEAAFGQRAWLVNGAGHLLLHLPTGVSVLLTLWPTAFILPYVVQHRRNTWVGVVIHGALNGPGFMAVAFGLV